MLVVYQENVVVTNVSKLLLLLDVFARSLLVGCVRGQWHSRNFHYKQAEAIT